MSWSDRFASTAAVPVLLVGTAFGLGGCFAPLYSSVGGNLGGELRAISVDPVPDKLGHYLRDQLLTDLNGTGDKPPAHYHLSLTTAERVQSALIDVTTGRPQNATVVTDVTWKLLPMDGGPAVANGTVTSFASYDRSAQRFANIRAARDAEIRDARTLADQITTQVAARLAARPGAAQP